ncbi:MAG: hypothetical protein AB7V22_00620 [Kiritimatiellia bacterium]
MPILLRRRLPSPRAISAPDRDRNWGRHLPAYRAEDLALLQALTIPLGFCVLMQILVQNWEIAAALMAFVDFNLLAAHDARQAEAPHRFARILCAIYFAAARHAATRRAVRRHVRLPVLFFFGFLLFFGLRIRFPLGHDRPSLVDWRRLYPSANWDYLRENNFFRGPPPAEKSPDLP